MKKFILFAFLMLSTISFASNLVVKTQEKNVTTIEAVKITNVNLQETAIKILPVKICITTYYEVVIDTVQGMDGLWYDVVRTYSSTYCG